MNVLRIAAGLDVTGGRIERRGAPRRWSDRCVRSEARARHMFGGAVLWVGAGGFQLLLAPAYQPSHSTAVHFHGRLAFRENIQYLHSGGPLS